MAYDRRALVGVGGWLAFFVVTLAVIGPLRSVAGVWRDLYADPAVATGYGPHWPHVQWLIWSTAISAVAASEYLAWRLVRLRTRATVKLVIVGLWLTSTVPSVIAIICISILSGIGTGTLAAGLGGEIARPLVYATIWTAYLLRSQRVANTYTDDTDTDRLAAVFD